MRNIWITLGVMLSSMAWGQSVDLMPEHSFTAGIEGPAADADGYIYAVNFEREGTIGRVDPKTAQGEIFVDLRSAVSDSSTANGIRFSPTDNVLYVVDYVGHNLLRIDIATRTVEVVAHNGAMHQPNDLALAPNGDIYMSDPDWKNDDGEVWLYKNGELKKVGSRVGTANGIEVSADGKNLYLGLSAQRKIMRYKIAADGTIGRSEVFASFAEAGLDGMRLDVKGNLYVARYDDSKVLIFCPQGKIIRTVELKGQKPSNLTFCGNQVYVTMADRGCFETFKARHRGREAATSIGRK